MARSELARRRCDGHSWRDLRPSDGTGTFRPYYLMERVSKAITATPGLTTRAIRAAVNGKNDAKDLALELLVIEGYVTVDLGPNRSKLHRSVMPFELSKEGGSDDDF